MGAISIWAFFVSVANMDEAGFVPAGIIGFMVFLPLSILIIPATICGPGLSSCLSLFGDRSDRNLMFMTGLSVLFVVLVEVLRTYALLLLILAYGAACLIIGTNWFTKKIEQNRSHSSE